MVGTCERRAGREGVVVSMSNRTRLLHGLFVAGVGLATCGCEDPPLVTAVPPGVPSRSIADIKEKEEPQAIGEAGSTGPAAEVKATVPDIPPALPTAKGEVKTTASGVKYETLKEGHGAVVKAGQRVTVHYVGKLDDGREFDSSRRRDKPAEFLIGIGKVIKGWDEAVPGMKIGEVRKLDVPAAAGYGALGNQAIPPNADLHFEIEMINTN
jgi:FKBP-type peptidyl-prolyl cis-trans isomerase